MAKGIVRLPGFSETDWPVLVHANIIVRRREGTRAWISWRDTHPPNNPEDAVRVTLESDQTSRDPEALLAVLETMVAQMRRQLDLRYERSR